MMDYAPLRDHLKAQDFRKADDETRALLIRLAGEGAIKRGWVYFTEVSTMFSLISFMRVLNLGALLHISCRLRCSLSRTCRPLMLSGVLLAMAGLATQCSGKFSTR
jgi:hypothetical protein